ncbi:type II toxin-antitoxin system RelE/ParE family toxin [Sulfurimonas sp.]|uniref:type II toxin-antitoxin system RelE/ParE family toxin n=1 Tax=Sulfurimonas sp. TaxID=2022749 RepID=UPI0019FC9B1C|nr:type II toxin-antitoxin system RelE/ParE family toxin [Sulfurimonas sp.]MBE0514285.1 type II toxin-antitoxin system RelE/ParE family toxin [Sulfurimonas sp.]
MLIDTSHRYEIELNKILDFIGKDNPKNALNFAKKLEAKINDLPHFPYKCRQSLKSKDNNLRELVFYGYVIPYRLNTKQQRVEILGIFSENEWEL